MSKIILKQGDCMELLKKVKDNSIDLVVTDPPYLIDTTGGGLYTQPDKQYVKELNAMKDGFSEIVLNELCRVMKKINIYFFCSQKQIIPLTDYFVTKRKCNWNILSWHKTNPIPACGNKYLTDTEFILFFREKGVKVYGEFNTKKTWYATPLNQGDKKKYGHPTVKPIEIVKNLIVNSSNENDWVLDPFMGSGTTGVGCKELDRNFIGFELDENYFNIARVNHPTQKPVQLMERCIKLWTNEGDTVLDFCMGSGSTGVACINTNRNFIGIELDEKYFKIAEERINNQANNA